MQPTVVTPFDDDTPTRVLNDAPTLIRIRRLAALARGRIQTAPSSNDLALASMEMAGIEALCTEALR